MYFLLGALITEYVQYSASSVASAAVCSVAGSGLLTERACVRPQPAALCFRYVPSTTCYTTCYTTIFVTLFVTLARYVRPQPWGPPAVLLATCAIMRFRPPPTPLDGAKTKKTKTKA